MKKATGLIILLSSIACNEVQLKKPEGVLSSKTVADGMPQTNISAEPSADGMPQTNISAEPVAEGLPQTSIPISIGGAALLCFNSGILSEITCEVRVNGVLIDMRPSNAYIVSGQNPVWTPVQYTSPSIGVYKAVIPAKTPSSYAFALRDDSGSFIFTWVGSDAPDLKNIVEDGSFDKVINPATPPADTWSYLSELELNAINSPWHVKYNETSHCAKGLDPLLQVEIQGGNRFLDLDSYCVGDKGEGTFGGNVSVYQQFKTLPNHIYNLRFDAKTNPGDPELASNAKAQNLVVTFNDIVLLDRFTVETSWTRFNLQVAAKDADATLTLSEKGVPNGFGTHLDAVVIYDLGVPPK